ncbi:hypothetical protein OOJ91_33675 [Micromonospora lupini]|uniref:hypothetical protein n=1 Tax=Micromonospora lupini TaxID=285679 RepID=UPI002251FDBF|nr:hypothetical protein [Micromonospora lupini]MCX5070797.1 hypothetical protein [Micromonospora lupini]
MGQSAFVTQVIPRYSDDDGPYADVLIQIDGRQIGGAYPCAGEPGDRWASWGPAGLSMKHPDRQAAVRAQIQAYAADPSGWDRILDEEDAEKAADRARRDRELQQERARRRERRRRDRLGDDEPGPTIVTIPAYHALYAPIEEATAVGDWLAAHGIEDAASCVHEIRVEQRAARRVVVYQALASIVDDPQARTETSVVTLAMEPPAIATPPRPDLHQLFDDHWPTRFPLIDYGRRLACGRCSGERRSAMPQIGSSEALVVWPCSVLQAQIGGGDR